MEESELNATLTSLCEKYQIKVLIDPVEYKLLSPAAIDVEHDEEGNLVGIGVYDGSQSFYFTLVTDSLRNKLLSLSLIAHNGKGDFDSLRQWGVCVTDEQLVWDTELIGHIIDSSRKGYGLKKLAKEDLGIEYPSYDALVGKKTAKVRRTLDKWPIETVSLYNALDCFVTYKLWEIQGNSSNPYPGISDYFEDLEKPVSYVFSAMETRGIRIDVAYLKQLKLDLEAQQRPIKDAILNELGTINLNSPKQLLEALHAKQIFPTFKGKASTDKRAFATLTSIPTIQRLLEFSELDTLLSSFVKPYLERGTEVVHPFFNQCGTRTGRPSCSNPNLLQIPKRTDNGKLVRRMFIPRDGMLLGDCDYGQIEPRVLAHLSKDPVMCQMFNDGIDFHTFTSERLNIDRDRAKVLNLSVGYRATKFSVQRQLGGTYEEAQKCIDAWWALFPALRRWQEALIYSSKKSGFCTTLFGRRIKVDGLEGNPWKKEAAERQLINNIAQGSAAEIIKKAMISLSKDARLSPSFGLLVQVYDELLTESTQMSTDINYVTDDMEKAVTLDVPLTVDAKVGTSWADCQ
jgi:DNA polymerase-1